MNTNAEELQKIMKKTSGWFKSKSRDKISKAISTYKPQIDAANSLPDNERKIALIVLAKQATDGRQKANHNGFVSYSDPTWVAAATIESWLFELLSGEENEIIIVEKIINELHNRK